MSSRKLKIVFAPLARSDIKDILNYTVTHWGERQLKTYRNVLRKAFQDIASRPESGRARHDLLPGLRSKETGKHVILYRMDGAMTKILRVLHERMDAARRLKELPPSFQEPAALSYKVKTL